MKSKMPRVISPSITSPLFVPVELNNVRIAGFTGSGSGQRSFAVELLPGLAELPT